MNNEIKIFLPKAWKDYELLDTGGGEKLERVGDYVFSRPYEGAVWQKTLGVKEWEKANGKFITSKKGEKAGWKFKNKISPQWQVSYRYIKFSVMPTPFRHYGFFPEQASHWEFIEEKIKSAGKPVKFLNLFGYTGIASLFALHAGAEVTHVDASKQSLSWAKENQDISGLASKPMRIIPDDVVRFLDKEIKRGNVYDAIVLDPPKFGRGPRGEVWKLEENMAELLQKIRKVLSPKPIFVIITSYAVDSSALALGYALEDAMQDLGGQVEKGELCLKEKSKQRTISLANTAIWFRG